eukprot:Transcript_7979.p1 GENE.Transcript_7979~~Transcript_7979.p1  ORF type:complete len:556 (+),score=225.23 Transcript_7979:68-1669(+)
MRPTKSAGDSSGSLLSPPGSPGGSPGRLNRGETTGSSRYARACTRLNIQADNSLLSALRDPKAYNGTYTTADAEQLLSPDGVRAIVTALDSSRGLHTVRLIGLRRLDGSFFTYEALGSLVRAVRANGSIRTLDLSDDALDDELAAGHLNTLLAHNASLTSLQLRNNGLGAKGGRAVLEALTSNRHLHELDLSCNPGLMRWNEQAPELERLLRENTALLSLGASVPSEKAFVLLNALGRSRPLPSLRLVHQQLGERVLLQIKSMLSSAKSGLTELDLTHAYCEEKGAIALAQALTTNRSLTRLSLAHNNIAAAGAVALGDSLKANCTLTDVSLASNHVNDAAAVGLAEMLTSNQTLTALELGRNCFGTVGAQALRQALQSNTSLTSLGQLETLPIGVGLRASLEWYVRNNKGWFEKTAAELQPKSRHHEGLLRLLPATERQLREQLFELEDSCARATEESEAVQAENYQVNRLLDVTVKRNAELVDSLSQLQSQVERLERSRKEKKKAAKKAPKAGGGKAEGSKKKKAGDAAEA